MPSDQRLSGLIIVMRNAFVGNEHTRNTRNIISFDSAQNAVTVDRPFQKRFFARTSYSISTASFQEGGERVQEGGVGVGRGNETEAAGLEKRGLSRSRSRSPVVTKPETRKKKPHFVSPCTHFHTPLLVFWIPPSLTIECVLLL